MVGGFDWSCGPATLYNTAVVATGSVEAFCEAGRDESLRMAGTRCWGVRCLCEAGWGSGSACAGRLPEIPEIQDVVAEIEKTNLRNTEPWCRLCGVGSGKVSLFLIPLH